MQPINEPYREQLLAYLEGILPPDKAAALEWRLAHSAALRAELDSLAQLMSDLECLGQHRLRPIPPVDVWGTVSARINELDREQCIIPSENLQPTLDIWVDVLLDDAVPPDDAGAPAWLDTLCSDFEVLGQAHKSSIPSIDVSDGVMKEIAPAEPVAIESASKRGWLKQYGWYGLAAAAGIALVIAGTQVLVGMDGPQNGEHLMGQADRHRIDEIEIVEPDSPPGFESPIDPTAGEPTDSDRPSAEVGEPSPTMEEVDTPDIDRATLRDIVETQQLAAQANSDAQKQIEEWARLPEDTARSVALAAGSSPGAIIAAAQSLGHSERELYLVTAAGQMNEHPGARMALAQTYYVQPERIDAAFEEVDKLYELDPQNALPYYIEAKLRLDAGDVEGALALLEQAAQLDMATAYGLDSAQFQEEALLAAGWTPKTAQLLSALTAGSEEYDFLYGLGVDLLDYGQKFAQADDFYAAEQVFESVMRLGHQLNEGAAFVPELMAALDIERSAVEMLGEIYAALGSGQGLQALADEAGRLMQSLGYVNEFTQSLQGLFAVEDDPEFWVTVSDVFMGKGSVPVLEMFSGSNLDIRHVFQEIAREQAP